MDITGTVVLSGKCQLAVYDFIYQLSSAIDGILDISIRTAEASQRDPPKSDPAF